MKRFIFVFAAMLAMVQINAAEVAEAISETPAATLSADNDNESTYQHPFTDDDESTKQWTVITSGFYFGMGIKHNWDLINNSFEIGLLNAVGVNYNSLHGQKISLGVGLNHRSYSIKRPNMLVRDANDAVVADVYPSLNIQDIKDRSSNLNVWTVQFPLMFQQRIVNKLDLSVAGILNWNTYARVDNHYELDNVEHDTKYKNLKQNKIGFDAMGILTWDDFGIYCRYSPGKFFKDGYGPEIKNTWTMGIMVVL